MIIQKKIPYCVVFVLLFSLASCETMGEDSADLSVSMKISNADSEAGSAFVTVKASGDWTLALEFQGDGGWASLDKTSGRGNTYDVTFKYDANTGDEARGVDLVLKSGRKTGRWSFRQDSPGGDGKPDAVPGWMELPAQKDGLDYYNYHFPMNGKQYRNYSLGWDKESRVAHWVAYPYCTFHKYGYDGRSDAWAFAPKIPESEQPYLIYNSYVNGETWNRGHQIASEDRQCTYDANAQTFYCANMTPQLGDFNQKIWQELEGRVRTVVSAQTDTLYIVTGCVVEGSTQTVRDRDNRISVIPVSYFKALLYYNKANTVGELGYVAAGYYLEHKAYPNRDITSSMSMSIDELEQKTGLDFFVNLASKIGEAKAALVEAQHPDDEIYYNSVWKKIHVR